VAFVSRATNLASGAEASSGFSALYVRDLCRNAPGCTPHTELVSIAADGTAANGPSTRPSLSGDGRFVAFESSATNLVAGVSVPAEPRIYVRDLCTGSTASKSCVAQNYAVPLDEQDRNAFAQGARPVISGSGRYVAFEAWTGGEAAQAGVAGASESAEVVIADTCLGAQVASGCKPTATRASVNADGSVLAGSNFSPSISASGRYVTFESQPASSRSESSAGSTVSHVFVRDTCLGATSGCTPSTFAVSADPLTMAAGRTEAYSPSISASGRYISFIAGSSAADTTTEGTIEVRDMCFGAGKGCLVHSYAANDTGSGCPSLGCNPDPTTIPAGCPGATSNSSGVTADKYTSVPLSANGRFAAFYAPESMPAQPSNGIGDIFMTLTPF
jgi:hypothetical protein